MANRRINSASSSSSMLRRTPEFRMQMAASKREASIREKEFWTHTSNYYQALALQNDRFNYFRPPLMKARNN